MNPKLTAVGALALTLGFVAVAFAQDMTPEEIVASRIHQLREMATGMKSINDELKKGRPLKIILTSSASQIAAIAKQLQSMFPQGTGPSSGIKMRATMRVWEHRADFEAHQAKLVDETAKLATVIRGTDFDAMRAQYKVTAQVCEGCHNKQGFRGEE